MKLKLMSIFSVLLLTLIGCQAADTGQQDDGNNPNVDQTAFPNNTNDNMIGDRNYTIDRDADRRSNFMSNRNNERMNDDTRNDSRYEVSKEAAEKITEKVKEIDSAYVLTTDNNAYVAAQLDNNDRRGQARNNENNRNEDGELTEEVKSKISKIVRSVDRDIDRVYVSTNPDFLDLANNYANDLDEGRPIEGFFDQIGNMIERLFPQNR